MNEVIHPEPIILTEEEKAGVYLVGGQTHPKLTDGIAQAMGLELGEIELRTHPSGDLYVRLGESVRNRHAIMVQPHATANGLTMNDSWRQHLEMIDAARFADAATITAVSPNFAGARQDRPAKPREAVSIRITLEAMKEAGAKRFFSVEAHSDQALYGPGRPVVPITTVHLLTGAINEEIAGYDREECLIIGPDYGSGKLVEKFVDTLDLDRKMVSKKRDKTDSSIVTHEEIERELIEGRTCIVVDDMIDTGGTIDSIAHGLHDNGAKRIIVAATHAWFSGHALELFDRDRSPIDKFIVTDTLPMDVAQHELGDRLITVTVAQIIAGALFRIVQRRSVSELPQGEGFR